MLHEWLDELGRLRKHGFIEFGSEGVHVVVPFCTTTYVHSLHGKHIYHSIASLDAEKRAGVDLFSILVTILANNNTRYYPNP